MHPLRLFLFAALLASCSADPVPSPSTSTPPAASVRATQPPPGGDDLTGQIAYVAGMDDAQIYLLDLASGESRQLTNLQPEDAELTGDGPLRPALSCGFGPSGLAWSPDGSQLAFAYGSCDSVVFLVNAEGEVRRIGDGRSPTWAPDGSHLLHAANVPYSPCGGRCEGEPPPAPGAWDLRIINLAEDGESRPFTADGSTARAGSPWYSPDGALIAYSGPPQGRDPEVFSATYVINADGSNPSLVANGGFPRGWTDGGRLLVTRERDGSVHAVDIESGESDQLGGEQIAAVSPDGDRVLASISDPVTGNSGLRLLTADGEPLAELPGGTFGDWATDSGAFVVFGPDSEAHVVTREGRLLASFEIEEAAGPAAWRPGS